MKYTIGYLYRETVEQFVGLLLGNTGKLLGDDGEHEK